MQNFDLVILGSGPAGYVGAIKAAQLGLKTAVVEKAELGGICLNYGCIPTKALLKAAEMYHFMTHQAADFGLTCKSVEVDFAQVIARSRKVAEQLNKGVAGLLRKNKVSVFTGKGMLQDSRTVEVSVGGKTELLGTKYVMVATGARPRLLPNVEVDGKQVLSAKEAMLMTSPPKSLCVIGAGAIGVEFAYFYSQFGTAVTLLEAQDRILPIEDVEVSETVARNFKKQGIAIKTSVFVEGIKTGGKEVKVALKSGEALSAEKVLVAVGVSGNVEGLGLEQVSVKVEKDKIPVNSFCQTNIPHIYAVGDVIGSPWLAHVASHEAITAVLHLAGKNPKPINTQHVPGCTYCQPQVASVGLTEEQAKKEGRAVKIGRFPFRANGKSLAAGDVEGFVKLIFDSQYGELIGAHLVGHDVTEMISGLVTLMECEVTQTEIAHAIHPHPTCSEAIMEAALDATGDVIHI